MSGIVHWGNRTSKIPPGLADMPTKKTVQAALSKALDNPDYSAFDAVLDGKRSKDRKELGSYLHQSLAEYDRLEAERKREERAGKRDYFINPNVQGFEYGFSRLLADHISETHSGLKRYRSALPGGGIFSTDAEMVAYLFSLTANDTRPGACCRLIHSVRGLNSSNAYYAFLNLDADQIASYYDDCFSIRSESLGWVDIPARELWLGDDRSELIVQQALSSDSQVVAVDVLRRLCKDLVRAYYTFAPLDEDSDWLTFRDFYQEEQVLRFVLMGEPLPVPAYLTGYRFNPYVQGATRITLDFDPLAVTDAEVLAIVRRQRIIANALHNSKPFQPQTLALLAFDREATAARLRGKAKHEAWNAKFPQWEYPRLSTFQEAMKDAKKRRTVITRLAVEDRGYYDEAERSEAREDFKEQAGSVTAPARKSKRRE